MPLLQSEASCTNQLYWHVNEKLICAPRLSLKKKYKTTWKWPIRNGDTFGRLAVDCSDVVKSALLLYLLCFPHPSPVAVNRIICCVAVV